MASLRVVSAVTKGFLRQNSCSNFFMVSLSETHQIKKLGELGVMGINVPEEYGGPALDSLALIIAVEEVASNDWLMALRLEAARLLTWRIAVIRDSVV